LFALNDRIPLKVVCAKHEYAVISTNPEEIKVWERAKELEKTELEIGELVLEARKPYFYRKDLNRGQVAYLKQNGYVDVRCPTLARGRGFDFLCIQPLGKESLGHFILVNLILEEVQKYTDNAVQSHTVNPDVMFFHKGERYAFEVETGSHLGDKKELLKKIELLNKMDGIWYFVVTSWQLKKKYSKWGRTLTRNEVPELLEKIFVE